MKWFHQKFAPLDAVRAQCPGGLCRKYAPGDARDYRGKCCPCGIGVVYRMEPGTWYFMGEVWNPLTWRCWKWLPSAGTERLTRDILEDLTQDQLRIIRDEIYNRETKAAGEARWLNRN